jgi:hypothetical protein
MIARKNRPTHTCTNWMQKARASNPVWHLHYWCQMKLNATSQDVWGTRTFDSGPPNVPHGVNQGLPVVRKWHIPFPGNIGSYLSEKHAEMQCLSMESAIKQCCLWSIWWFINCTIVASQRFQQDAVTAQTVCTSTQIMWCMHPQRLNPGRDNLAHWAFRQRFPSERRCVQNTPNNKPYSKQQTRQCIDPLTPNDLQRRRPVSPLKIKISSKNMYEEPTNTPIIHSVY